jgi:hypothetical protein
LAHTRLMYSIFSSFCRNKKMVPYVLIFLNRISGFVHERIAWIVARAACSSANVSLAYKWQRSKVEGSSPAVPWFFWGYFFSEMLQLATINLWQNIWWRMEL